MESWLTGSRSGLTFRSSRSSGPRPRAKKRFGQHFLSDANILRRIVDATEIGYVVSTETGNDFTGLQLTDELRRDLDEVVRKHGGALDTIGHPTTTLEDYFLRIVEESKSRPGRRYQAPPDAKAS